MATVRLFAGARDAAGVESTVIEASTLGTLTDSLLSKHPALADVLPRCSLLVNGVRSIAPPTPITSDTTIDVLPPFAGG